MFRIVLALALLNDCWLIDALDIEDLVLVAHLMHAYLMKEAIPPFQFTEYFHFLYPVVIFGFKILDDAVLDEIGVVLGLEEVTTLANG